MSLSEPTTAAEIRERARSARRRLMGAPQNAPTRFDRTCRPKTVSAAELEIDTCSQQHVNEAEELIARLRTLDVTFRHLTEAEEIIAKLRRPVYRIIRAACQYFGMRRIDLISNRRTKLIVRPRQIAMFLARELTPYSLPEIGRRFGGRDHTTVLHSCRTVERLCRDDPDVAYDVVVVRALATNSDPTSGES